MQLAALRLWASGPLLASKSGFLKALLVLTFHDTDISRKEWSEASVPFMFGFLGVCRCESSGRVVTLASRAVGHDCSQRRAGWRS